MTPQEICLIVLLVVIAGYMIAALWPRSKSGDEPADIVLESRLPGAPMRNDELIPASGKTSLKNIRRTRRKSEPVSDSAEKPSPDPVRIQRHHESPKAAAKSDKIREPGEEGQLSAISEPVQSAAVSAPDREMKQETEQPEAIDPELTGQISELDDRLDAIEKLVTSIEESLATFDLLEDSPAGEAQAA